jgi:hypothetical protein
MQPPKKLLLTLLCALLAGCGGGPAFSAGRFSDEEAGYRVGKLDSTWTRVEVGEHNDLAWLNERLNAIIQVNASCDPAKDVPLKALTNHLLIGFTERSVHAQDLIPVDGREALRTHLSAKLDGVERELVLTVLKKDGCVYDFSLIASDPANFSVAVRDYDGVVAGFRSR